MNNFKKIMMQSHMQSKDCLHKLYTDKQIYISAVSSSQQPIEDEKIFYYRDISFAFAGTGFRTPEKVVLYVWVPAGKEVSSEKGKATWEQVPFEDWLLRNLSEPINTLQKTLENDHKDSREKPEFSMQEVDCVVRRRNGCLYVEERDAFRLRIAFHFPLIGGHSVNGKSSYKGIKLLLDTLCDNLENAERENLKEHIQLYRRQLEIRDYLEKNGLLAFVSDGSILPRQGDSQNPMEGAIPFQSPPSLRVTIPCSDGTVLTGMGIQKGITVITGGGYGGKSTLLDALEQGIYFHVKGDGREYVITEETACKIYAEDGRYVQTTDLSPFFSYMPGTDGVHAFSTVHASGSVSQAVNIVEAVYGGCRCLLIDEDTSATNFMIRDRLMRRLVQKEPIIPYTDRIRELKELGVSTILVIGGSGEYLKYGDCILLLEDYRVYDRTMETQELLSVKDLSDWKEAPRGIDDSQEVFSDSPVKKYQEKILYKRNYNREIQDHEQALGQKDDDRDVHIWMNRKILPREMHYRELSCGHTVEIDHGRYIRLGEITVDVTWLTALGTGDQINTLAWLLERLLLRDWQEGEDLGNCCKQLVQGLFEDSFDVVLASRAHRYELWLEEVRSLDLLMAAARLRKPC